VFAWCSVDVVVFRARRGSARGGLKSATRVFWCLLLCKTALAWFTERESTAVYVVAV
jgi:hypothetical protein